MHTPRDASPPKEDLLVGRWVETATGVVGDEACTRIASLIQHSFEVVAEHPEEGGWRTLYRDPRDGQLWERTYPQSHMHGGGPPSLSRIAAERAKAEFKL
jgi:hypothetical protein